MALLLLAGIHTPVISLLLFGSGFFLLHRFQGPYNGGSDLMTLLIVFCLTLVRWVPSDPDGFWRDAVFAYLALQAILSYFKAGWAKVRNPDWRNGQALRDVFLFSAYPVSEQTRAWAERPRVLWAMAWAVVLFELLFPLTLLTTSSLIAGLALGATFHVANAMLFGFNRFVWTWIATYPAIPWLHFRLAAVWG